jgi:hypothetical protein
MPTLKTTEQKRRTLAHFVSALKAQQTSRGKKFLKIWLFSLAIGNLSFTRGGTAICLGS